MRYTEVRMSRLAQECGAINLSQGFPDFNAEDLEDWGLELPKVIEEEETEPEED